MSKILSGDRNRGQIGLKGKPHCREVSRMWLEVSTLVNNVRNESAESYSTCLELLLHRSLGVPLLVASFPRSFPTLIRPNVDKGTVIKVRIAPSGNLGRH
jgi:hypothetical protein